MSQPNGNPMQTQSFSDWHIVARLRDGSVIIQLDFVGEINRRREQVSCLELYFKNELKGRVDLSNSEQRLILVKRTRIDFGEDRKQVGGQTTILVGWQSTIEGQNVKCLLFLFDNGEFTLRNYDNRSVSA
jgi:hypothetical protein